MRFASLALAAALIAVATPTQGQDGRGPGGRGERMDPKERIERRVQMLDERLDLSDEQVSRITAILTKESEQMRANFQQGGPPSGDREAMRAQMQAQRERTDGEISKVLNATQLKKYQELEKEMRDRRPGGGDRPPRN